MTIETENLTLIACDAALPKTAIAGNESLEREIQVKVPDNWTEFGTCPP